MKKKTKKIYYVIASILLIFALSCSIYAVDIKGYGEYNIYSYQYDTDINNISYELLYKNNILLNTSDNTYDWGFIDLCLSIMGLNYDILNITTDNSDILSTLPTYVNSGQAYAHNHDFTQINLSRMTDFISQWNKLSYSCKGSYYNQINVALRLNETLRVGIIKNVNVIFKFLLVNNLISEDRQEFVLDNIKNYMLYSTDSNVQANNEFTYYNIFNMSGNRYQHLYIELQNITNSEYDIMLSKNYITDSLSWSFMPPIILNQILACLSAIVTVGVTFGIFSLAKKVI